MGNSIRAGVLIIGSLLWQSSSTRKPWDNARENWRNNHLVINRPIKVKAPVRYGRHSVMRVPVRITHSHTRNGFPVYTSIKERKDGSMYIQPRGNFDGLYTMLLSKDYDNDLKMGTAYIFELKRQIKTLDDVKTEVKALSKAEGIFLDESRYFRQKWGGVSIWLSKKNFSMKEEIQQLWQEKLGNEKWLKQFSGFDERGSILNNMGQINIEKFVAINNDHQNILDDFGFVLVAVTVPKHKNNNLKKYPSPAEVGELAQIDLRRYFQNNNRRGIVTADDSMIMRRIKNMVNIRED